MIRILALPLKKSSRVFPKNSSHELSIYVTLVMLSKIYLLGKYHSTFSHTLHNGASNEIKEIKVFKKCPKVEPYCMPIFDPNRFEPF